MCLCHGDDPYQLRKYQDVPGIGLLIDGNYFKSYVQNDNFKAASGLCWAKAKLDYLPKRLVKDYCMDGDASYEEGKVYEQFKDYYLLKGLEMTGLWNKLESKAQSLGGCQAPWMWELPVM